MGRDLLFQPISSQMGGPRHLFLEVVRFFRFGGGGWVRGARLEVSEWLVWPMFFRKAQTPRGASFFRGFLETAERENLQLKQEAEELRELLEVHHIKARDGRWAHPTPSLGHPWTVSLEPVREKSGLERKVDVLATWKVGQGSLADLFCHLQLLEIGTAGNYRVEGGVLFWNQ